MQCKDCHIEMRKVMVRALGGVKLDGSPNRMEALYQCDNCKRIDLDSYQI